VWKANHVNIFFLFTISPVCNLLRIPWPSNTKKQSPESLCTCIHRYQIKK
jgi:hypothetical protein